MKHSRGNQVKNTLLSTYDKGVAGVVTTLKTNNHICLGSQPIYDFTFAFIAPLSAHNCDYRHVLPRFPIPSKNEALALCGKGKNLECLSLFTARRQRERSLERTLQKILGTERPLW